MGITFQPLTRKQREELHSHVAWGTVCFRGLLFRAAVARIGVFKGGYRVPLAMILSCGCSEGSRITAVARLDPPLAARMLSMTARDDKRGWTWQPSDFHSSLERPTPTSRDRETHTEGEIEVGFRLQTSGLTLSEGSVRLPLRPEWHWTVQVVSATSDPRVACVGCVGSKAFPLASEYRGPERDSVWLIWGGDSIRGPAAY